VLADARRGVDGLETASARSRSAQKAAASGRTPELASASSRSPEPVAVLNLSS
jgi:hypothetical protein